MKWLYLVVLLLASCWPNAAPAADNPPRVIHIDGVQITSPAPLTKGNEVLLPLNDPQTGLLLKTMGTQGYWSAGPATCSLYAGRRALVWQAGQSSAQLDGVSVPVPTPLAVVDGVGYLPLRGFAALWGYRVTDEAGGGLLLEPVITHISVGVDAGGALKIHVQGAPGILPAVLPSQDATTLHLSIPRVTLAEGDVFLAERGVVVQARTVPGSSPGVDIVCAFPAYWRCKEVTTDSPAGAFDMTASPDFPLQAGYGVQAVTGVAAAGADASALTVTTNGPVQYFWRVADGGTTLVLELPQASLSAQFDDRSSASPWVQHGAAVTVSGAYKVARFEWTLKPGAHAIVRPADAPNALIVDFGASAQVGGSASGGGVTGPAGPVVAQRHRGGLIVIDPGHGGRDSGAVNWQLGIMEKDVTLAVALKLRDALTQAGYDVILTRSGDYQVAGSDANTRSELWSRCDIANKAGADIFVSLHCNSAPNLDAQGSSIHYYKSEDVALAASLKDAVGPAFGVPFRGTHFNRFYVLRHTNMPAVLVEMAFLSNVQEAGELADGSFQQSIAQSLSTQISAYLQGAYSTAGR